MTNIHTVDELRLPTNDDPVILSDSIRYLREPTIETTLRRLGFTRFCEMHNIQAFFAEGCWPFVDRDRRHCFIWNGYQSNLPIVRDFLRLMDMSQINVELYRGFNHADRKDFTDKEMRKLPPAKRPHRPVVIIVRANRGIKTYCGKRSVSQRRDSYRSYHG